MDHCLSMDGNSSDDIESCRTMNDQESSAPSACATVENSLKGETRENISSNPRYGHEVCPENVQVLVETNNKVGGVVSADLVEKKAENEKRKSLSAKKPPKPPRPPRGLSMDAADQKLVKELAELAMMKRARIERMKALKKMKAAKAPSSSMSSSGSLFAMLCTVLFCVVIICQGMSSRNSTAMSFHNSLVSAGAMDSSFLMVEDRMNLPATAKNSSDSLPPDLPAHVSGSDTENFGERADS